MGLGADVTTCDGTDQPWTVNITGSLSGDPDITLSRTESKHIVSAESLDEGSSVAILI
jgi:hypothetical protein